VWSKGGRALPSLPFIRFAKITVLIADIWTLAYLALVFGWQTFIFVRDGSWHALPLSIVFGTQRYSDGDVDSTASIDKIGQSQATFFADALLQMPILTLLLLAAAFLSAFYLWLHNTEKRVTNM
jgi:hypothetical protein